MINNIKRGEIYLADLSPTIGSEQGGKRPVIILQNDIGNTFSTTTIVAPLTSHMRFNDILPTHVYIKSRDALEHDSTILLEQIRTIDKTRLIKKITALHINELHKVDECVVISIGLR